MEKGMPSLAADSMSEFDSSDCDSAGDSDDFYELVYPFPTYVSHNSPTVYSSSVGSCPKRKYEENTQGLLCGWGDSYRLDSDSEDEPSVSECKVGQWDPQQLLELCVVFGAVQGSEKCSLRPLQPMGEDTMYKLAKVEGHGKHLTISDWISKGFIAVSVDGSGNEGASKSVSRRTLKFKKKKVEEAAAVIPRLAEMGGDVVAEKLERVSALQEEYAALEAEWKRARASAVAGCGVFVQAHSEWSSATRIPDHHVFGDKDGTVRNTSQLAEGFAILIALLSVDRRLDVVIRSDSQYWCNVILYGWREWVFKQQSGASPEVHHNLKAAIFAAIVQRSGKLAIVKVKAHCGDTDNEHADFYAKCGKSRQGCDWSMLSDIDWKKLVGILVGCTSESNSRAKRSKASVREVGEMVQGEKMTPTKAAELRTAVLPQLEVMFRKVHEEVHSAASNSAAAVVAQRWYATYTKLLFDESAKLLGTKVFGRGQNAPMQTKDFKKDEVEVRQLDKTVKKVQALVNEQQFDEVSSGEFECLSSAAAVVPHRPTRNVQWRVLLSLAEKEVIRRKVDLENRRVADSKDAKTRSMIGAVKSGRLKRLKNVAFDSKASEILLSGIVLGAHFAKGHQVPPGFIRQPFKFGPVPGFRNADADRALVIMPFARELIRHWKGKKKSSTPGPDGIPYVVRSALIAEEGGVGAPEMDCLFYSFVYSFGFVYDEWHKVLDWPLRKGGKDSYLVPNAYRNISCVDIPRKVLGRVWWSRTCEWLYRCGKYGKTQVSGRKGFPGVMYASTLVKCAIRVAEHFKMSIVVTFFDLNNFYPRIDIRIISGVMLWLGIPSDVVLMFTMVHADNKAVLMVAGKICYRYDIHGIFQGCNTAIKCMIVVSLVWCFALECSEIGFQWPLRSLQLQGVISPGFKSHGVAVSDDLAALAGGADKNGNPMHWKDVVRQAKKQIGRVFDVYEQLPVPVGEDKMVVAALFYENGVRVYPTVSVPIYGERGWTVTRVVPLDDPVTHLGVAQATREGSHRAFTKRNLECEAEGHALSEDSSIPFVARWKLWAVSLLGKRKYVVDKEEQAVLESGVFAKASRKIFKQAIGLVVPNAVMHAREVDWGFGLVDTQQSDLRMNVFAAMALANRSEEWVYNVFLIYLNLSRLVNKVKLAQDDSISFKFFDWDTTGLVRRRFEWQNEFVHFAIACAKRGFSVTQPSSCCDSRVKWCLVPDSGTKKLLQLDTEVVGASKCADALALWSDLQWATELKTLKLAGVLARNQNADPVLSNKWKKRGKVNDSTLRFHVKASCGLLATPARQRIIGAWTSAVCSVCGFVYADVKHALNGCGPLASRVYQWRHQQVLNLVEAAVQRQWVVVSKEQDVSAVWPTAVTIRELAHTRPDLVLMDGATDGFLKIIVLDVAVAFDRDVTMRNAFDEKMRRYQPLADAIAATSDQAVNTSVQVVPVVVGSLGTIQTDWLDVMTSLRVSRKDANKLAEKVSIVAIRASQWIWKMYAGLIFGHIQLHQVKPGSL